MSFQIEFISSESGKKCQKCNNTPAWKYVWGHPDNYKINASRSACDAHLAVLREEAKMEIDGIILAKRKENK